MEDRMFLSKAQVLGADDLKFEDVPVPEWPNADGSPGVVRCRQLSAEDSLAMTREVEKDKATDGQGLGGMFIILVHCVVLEDGSPMFTLEDVPALQKKSMRVLHRLQKVCLRLNSMNDAAEVAIKKA